MCSWKDGSAASSCRAFSPSCKLWKAFRRDVSAATIPGARGILSMASRAQEMTCSSSSRFPVPRATTITSPSSRPSAAAADPECPASTLPGTGIMSGQPVVNVTTARSRRASNPRPRATRRDEAGIVPLPALAPCGHGGHDEAGAEQDQRGRLGHDGQHRVADDERAA